MVVDQSWNSRGLVCLQLSDDWARVEQQRRLAKDMAADNTSCSVSTMTQVRSKQSQQAKNVLVSQCHTFLFVILYHTI